MLLCHCCQLAVDEVITTPANAFQHTSTGEITPYGADKSRNCMMRLTAMFCQSGRRLKRNVE
jgi:hypothetical protein